MSLGYAPSGYFHGGVLLLINQVAVAVVCLILIPICWVIATCSRTSLQMDIYEESKADIAERTRNDQKVCPICCTEVTRLRLVPLSFIAVAMVAELTFSMRRSRRLLPRLLSWELRFVARDNHGAHRHLHIFKNTVKEWVYRYTSYAMHWRRVRSWKRNITWETVAI